MSLKSFIIIGRAESISAIVLFLVAMPLKYLADMPAAVKYVGWAHGILFVLFCVALVIIGFSKKWSFGKMVLLFLAAWIPAGPLLFEKRLLRDANDG